MKKAGETASSTWGQFGPLSTENEGRHMVDFRRRQAGQFRERELVLAEGRPDSVISAVKDEEAPRRRQANMSVYRNVVRKWGTLD